MDTYSAQTARMYDNSVMSGNSRLYDNSIMKDNSILTDAALYGRAVIMGDGKITRPGDYITLGPAISSDRFTTAHRDTIIGVRVNCGCFSGSIEEFAFRIESTHGEDKNSPAYKQYCLFLEYIKQHFAFIGK